MGDHVFRLTSEWTGNAGAGTTGYREYARDVMIRVDGKPELAASAAPAFRGDATRWNPEDLLLAALSECHLLSYLHACVTRGVIVVSYLDDAEAVMAQEGNGGHFTEAVLRPRVTVADPSMIEAARDAHHDAHEWCFIAASMNFPVRIDPTITAADN